MADDYASKVAARIIEQLRAGTAPWLRPWTPGKHFLPYNPISGAQYRGMNAVWLMAEGFERGFQDARWMTYRQAATAGAQVRRGEKGTVVQYWQWEGRETVRDEHGQPVIGPSGKPLREDKKFERPRVFSSVVFNAQQIDGLAPDTARAAPAEVTRHEQAESLIEASGARIDHEAGDRAYYLAAQDRIVLPQRNQFASSDGYYATALHEISHWSGHASRLNRDLSHPFGSEGYAREELRAEIASLMLGDELGIGHDPGQHVAYIDSWIRVLEREPREIFRAAADAERIARFLQGFARKADIALEPIRERSFDEPDRMQVQAQAIAAAQASPESFLRRYARLEQAFGGRYVCADLFKELFSDYRASKESRTRYNAPVHNSAAVLASLQLKEMLSNTQYPERDTVILLTGIPGAGKTTSVLQAGQIEPHVRAIYEGQLADPALAVERVEQILAAGLRPLIVAVHVKPETALERTLLRYEELGRGSSMNLIAQLSAGLPAGLEAVRERFGERVPLLVIDRRNAQEHVMREGWEQLAVLKSEGTYEEIQSRLTTWLERRRADGLSSTAYEQALGRAPRSVGMAQGTEPANAATRERSGQARGSGEETLLRAASANREDLEATRESQLASDRLALLAARRTHRNAESVAETVRAHEGRAQTEGASQAQTARFDMLRESAEREAFKQEQPRSVRVRR